MLAPVFYQIDEEMAIAMKDSQFSYWLLGYSQYANFTLVRWAYGDSEEYFSGEKLFRDETLVASAAGSLGLSASDLNSLETGTPNKQLTNYTNGTLNDYNILGGQYGLSSLAVRSLIQNYQIL